METQLKEQQINTSDFVNNSIIQIYDKLNNTTLHIVTEKNKECLDDIQIYYCLITLIIPTIKEHINKNIACEDDKIDNNYLITLGAKNGLILENYNIINNLHKYDICVFNNHNIDEIIGELQYLYKTINNNTIRNFIDSKIIDINSNDSDLSVDTQPLNITQTCETFDNMEISNNINEEIVKNRCKYCNKKFIRLGSIPAHEERCKNKSKKK